MPHYRPGLDRQACAECGHRLDMHQERGNARGCVVCYREDPEAKVGACVKPSAFLTPRSRGGRCVL